MREGVLMNEQLLKMNGLSVKILDMLSFESHLGMGYEFTTENIQTYLNDVAGVRIVCAFIDDIYMISDLITQQDDIKVIEIKDYIKIQNRMVIEAIIGLLKYQYFLLRVKHLCV